MTLLAQIEVRNAPDPREAERHATDTNVSIREMGFQKCSARVLDISTHGFKVETSSRLTPDSAIWITLPGLAPLLARVAWVDKFTSGCRFAAPLHSAVFDWILQQREAEKPAG